MLRMLDDVAQALSIGPGQTSCHLPAAFQAGVPAATRLACRSLSLSRSHTKRRWHSRQYRQPARWDPPPSPRPHFW